MIRKVSACERVVCSTVCSTVSVRRTCMHIHTLTALRVAKTAAKTKWKLGKDAEKLASQVCNV
jgi:hypothetical protein